MLFHVKWPLFIACIPHSQLPDIPCNFKTLLDLLKFSPNFHISPLTLLECTTLPFTCPHTLPHTHYCCTPLRTLTGLILCLPCSQISKMGTSRPLWLILHPCHLVQCPCHQVHPRHSWCSANNSSVNLSSECYSTKNLAVCSNQTTISKSMHLIGFRGKFKRFWVF